MTQRLASKHLGAVLLLAAALTACPSAGGGGGNPDGGGGGGGQPGSLLPAGLQGEWHYGTISPIEYYDPGSGKYAEASGTSDILKLTAEGRYERVGIIVVTTGSCTSKLFVQNKGTVQLEGNRLTFQPATAYAKGYTCNPSNAYERRDASPSSFTWRLEKDNNSQEVLVLGDPQGKTTDSRYNRPRGSGGNPNPGGSGGAVSGRLVLKAADTILGEIVVMACPLDGGCGNEAKWRFTRTPLSNRTADFRIEGLLAEPYNVYAWNDKNGNRAPDAGDLIGVYTEDGQSPATVTAPAEGLVIEVDRAE